jgi:hypothetical protein
MEMGLSEGGLSVTLDGGVSIVEPKDMGNGRLEKSRVCGRVTMARGGWDTINGDSWVLGT